jgi:hypothetical protein
MFQSRDVFKFLPFRAKSDRLKASVTSIEVSRYLKSKTFVVIHKITHICLMEASKIDSCHTLNKNILIVKTKSK